MLPETTHGNFGKLRWHCRRGLLELDLILEKFLARHLEDLDAGQIAVLQELLALPDNDLFDMVMERMAVPDARYDAMLKMLRTP
jgi:antitoxin CptB